MKWKKCKGFQLEVTKHSGLARDSITKHLKHGFIDKNGYKIISTRKDNGKRTLVRLSKIILLTWKGKPSLGIIKPESNHIDLDKSNNDVYNLEWLSHNKNIRHAIKTGAQFGCKGEKNGMSRKNRLKYGININQKGENNFASKLTIIKVIDIRFLYSTDLYDQYDLAKELNVSQATISNVLNNKLWNF
jgi:hypothetical protein